MHYVLDWLGPLGGFLFRRGMYKRYLRLGGGGRLETEQAGAIRLGGNRPGCLQPPVQPPASSPSLQPQPPAASLPPASASSLLNRRRISMPCMACFLSSSLRSCLPDIVTG